MKSADISIIGPDSKGIVATITNFIFENQCNIEEVSQNVVNGTFFMNVKISINKKKFDKEIFNKELAREAKQLGMKSRVFYDEQKQKKNMAILVTKEDHVLSELLIANKDGKLDVNIPIVQTCTLFIYCLVTFILSQSARAKKEGGVIHGHYWVHFRKTCIY
mgnify:CR=1 FL=1